MGIVHVIMSSGLWRKEYICIHFENEKATIIIGYNTNGKTKKTKVENGLVEGFPNPFGNLPLNDDWRALQIFFPCGFVFVENWGMLKWPRCGNHNGNTDHVGARIGVGTMALVSRFTEKKL